MKCCREKKQRVLLDITPLTAALSFNWNADDIYPVERFTRGLTFIFPQTDEIETHSFAPQRLGGPPRPWIGGIVGEQHDSTAFPAQPPTVSQLLHIARIDVRDTAVARLRG